MLLKEESPGSTNLRHSQSAGHNLEDEHQEVAIYLLQALLIAALLALDRHLRKVIANEALQHALRHTAAIGESVLAAVITNTLWHCLSHHQWADVAAAAYGCVAAYALTHSAWVNHLDMLAVYHNTNAGTKAVAMLALLCAIVFAQAGSLRLQKAQPGIAAVVAATVLLATAPSHGGTITIGTADLSCQLYVAAYIGTCTAARTICYVLDRLEQTAWHLRQQLTAKTVAATLIAAVLLMASVNFHQQADGHLATISIAVPPPTDYYTVMVSLTIISLPSVTLEPASMAQHQLKESWDESWCIMASGKRTMAPAW
jgi:hypothetical protein